MFNPGGDPAALRRAAEASRALAVALNNVPGAVEPVVADLKAKWHGAASDAFQQNSTHLAPAISDYTKQLTDAATSLDNIAAALEEAQIQSEKFEEMIAITIGIALVLGLLTFGTADALALPSIEAEVVVMGINWSRLIALFTGETDAIAGFLRAMSLTMKRFAYGLGLNIAATAGVKGVLAHENILDPASYTAKDYTNLLLASSLTASLGFLGGTKTVGGWLAAHPILGIGIAGGGGGALLSGIGQVWLNGNAPWSPDTLKSVGWTLLFSGGSGLIIGGAATGVANMRAGTAATSQPADVVPGVDPMTTDTPVFPPPLPRAVTTGDLVRGASGIPADAAEYYVTIPRNPPKTQVQSPRQKPEAAQPPPNKVVAHGNSLWAIAEREYGDGSKYQIIADANHIEDPDHIEPEQDLLIPTDPRA